MIPDLVIRGGLLVDGTGAPARPGDLAVADGRIAEVGAVGGRGRREVDAASLAVAPGFIDPHTHYDAQLTWDATASCSSWHGVTTVVTGNCGFTIAPCRSGDRETLMRMLQYVEGMSVEAMRRGIRWDFETFGEYLGALDRARPWVNVAALVGHSAIRQYVMGEGAWEREASGAEIARMAELVREAMADHVPAEDVEHDVQVQVGPRGWAQELGCGTPGPGRPLTARSRRPTVPPRPQWLWEAETCCESTPLSF